MKYLLAYVAVCFVWLVVGIAVGFGLHHRRSRRASRRVESQARSQLDTTGIHHVDTPAERRAPQDKDRDGHS